MKVRTVHARTVTNPVTPEKRKKHKKSGKQVIGESDDSSLYLNAHKKAVTLLTVSVPLEQGSPTVS
jgi:hypothetical protein